jgi:hypothetical protein
MATQWQSVLNALPPDGSEVWIRAPFFYSDPALATFDLSTQQFTTTETGAIIPIYIIGRWKSTGSVVARPIGEAHVGTDLIVG